MALAVLVGAATAGRAATANGVLTPTVSVLNDPVGGLILGTPTPGGNIGYDIKIFNDPTKNTNTLNHIAFTDTSSTGSIVFLNAPSNVSCTGFGTSTLSCTSAQLAVGQSFDVIVLFSTDPNGSGTISNVLTGTYAPASNNTTNKRSDPTKVFSVTKDRQYADSATGNYAQSLLLPQDNLNDNLHGHLHVAGPVGQTSDLTMPPGLTTSNFLNNNNYVGVTLTQENGANLVLPTGCGTCIKFKTNTTIPLASTYPPGPSNPFYDGTTVDPYAWTIFIPGSVLPNGFKPTNVFHVDDSGHGEYLPKCGLDANNNPVLDPTKSPGLCLWKVTQVSNTKDVTYYGLGIDNGSNWPG